MDYVALIISRQTYMDVFAQTVWDNSMFPRYC